MIELLQHTMPATHKRVTGIFVPKNKSRRYLSICGFLSR